MSDTGQDIVCRSIGIVHSPYLQVTGMPIQMAGALQARGSLQVHAEFLPGLKDLAGFEYLILLTHLHFRPYERLEVVPFLDDQVHGVFATRAPARPDRIGMSIVRPESIEGPMLHLTGNDMVDGTPVLDIKPYVPAFDVRQTDRIGWLSLQLGELPTIRSDDRMG